MRAVVPGAAPNRVFAATELPRILANEQVTSLEGLPREVLAEVHARDGQAAFEMVAARSHASIGELRVAVNYSGALLRDDEGRLQLDSRTYFKEGPVQGRAPSIPTGTRDLGELAGPPTPHVEAGHARVQAWRMETVPDAGLHVTPEGTRLTRSLGRSVGIAGAAAEVVGTAQDYTRLHGEGNLTAAQAALRRSVSTGAGAWAGFEAGATLGSPGGPISSFAVGALGAVVGGIAGDKIADEIQQKQIYTQRGSDHNTWQTNPAHPEQGWTRTLPPLPTAPQGQRFTASPALADELNYKAASKATELGMAAAAARDPYTLPASREDTFSPYGGDWIRNPASGGWQRQINYDRPGLGHPETASPQRATLLDAQSHGVIADNAVRSPAALAATFKALYVQSDWQRHGKVPEAIENTLARPQQVLASDGLKYDRQGNGQWTHDGRLWDSRADGNLRAELDLAVEAQRTHVQTLLHPGQTPGHEVPTLETVRVTPSPEQQAEVGAPASAPIKSVEPRAALLPERLSDALHPGHAEFQRVLTELHSAETNRGVPHGKHSEQVAAALLVEGERQGLRIDRVRIVADGQVEGSWQQDAFSDPKTVRVEPDRALSMSLEEHSKHWAQARSPHLVSDASAVERTAQQQRGIASLSPADQTMFARIRQDVPGHISDDQVMRALHDAKRADIPDADRIGQVMMAGERICIAGTIPGFRCMTELAQNAPPLQETVEQVQSLNQQRDQQMAMEQHQRNQDRSEGRGGPSIG